MAQLKKVFPDGVGMSLFGDLIQEALPKEFAFVLLVAPFGEHGMANYIANAHREDMIKFLRETADRLEKGDTPQTPNYN
jgi:hypothetical protein